MSDYKSDIEIAREAKLRPIAEIAGKIGLNPGDLIAYGEHKAKIKNAQHSTHICGNTGKWQIDFGECNHANAGR